MGLYIMHSMYGIQLPDLKIVRTASLIQASNNWSKVFGKTVSATALAETHLSRPLDSGVLVTSPASMPKTLCKERNEGPKETHQENVQEAAPTLSAL
jgi:hypothetical protein